MRFAYKCTGPFQYGTNNSVCVHGWNCSHALTDAQAQETDKLTNCGLLPDRQSIEKIEEKNDRDLITTTFVIGG
jgi:hypothetical protein